jgi:hypothetical protein
MARRFALTDNEPRPEDGEADRDPRPWAVTFVTTEHFALQGARAATVAESTGRASMFLVSVSGGVVALGLVATASRIGTAFYAFGIVLLPTLAFVGFVTFERVLQSAIEDHELMRRIALLRRYYFDNAPELARYLVTIEPFERLRAQGFPFRRQALRTVAGMVAVITAVLAGSTASLIAIVSSDHSGAAALISGVTVAAAVLTALMRALWSALRSGATTPLVASEDEGPV